MKNIYILRKIALQTKTWFNVLYLLAVTMHYFSEKWFSHLFHFLESLSFF